MSNVTRIENLKQIVTKAQPSFEELAKIHGAVNFKREAAFALQCLENGDYLSSVALKNQDSLRNAVLNVAAIGLSLSPVHKLAYLVPRDGKVCLDVSYQGLIQLAIDCGAIKWCVADLVCANDDFVLTGLGKEPQHNFKPFSIDRGDVVGGYCCAKTPDGDFITTIMEIGEIDKIRDRSEAFKKKSGPWISDESEMIKKTLIRRAYKSWPKKASETERLAKAMHLEEEAEAIDTTAIPVDESERTAGLALIREGLVLMGRSEADYLKHLTNVCRRDIKKIEDLTEIELKQAVVGIKQFIEQKKAADEAAKLKEAKNENAAANK